MAGDEACKQCGHDYHPYGACEMPMQYDGDKPIARCACPSSTGGSCDLT